MPPIRIQYYSDVLCVWAYISQRRVDELVDRFSDQIAIETHYCSVFPDAWDKIATDWKAKGGFEGFNGHIREIASRFPHITVHDRLWLENRPRTSAGPHIFLKAVEIVEREAKREGVDSTAFHDRLSTRAAWDLRRAFFVSAKDISDWQVQREVADKLGIDCTLVEAKIRSSEAVAQLVVDYNHSQLQGVKGSPAYVMNDGRQKLFGNVGYRLLEANVMDLLHNPSDGEASWC